MKNRPFVVPTLALAAILNAMNSDWIYSSLYYYTHPLWKICATLLIPLLLAYLAALVAARLIGEHRVVKLLNIATFVIGAFFVYDILKRNGTLEGNHAIAIKILIAASVLAAAVAASLRLSPGILNRLRVAILAGSALFLLTPEIVFPVEHVREVMISPYFHPATAATQTNTVVVLLDELSYLQPSSIEDALRADGRQVFAKSVTASGTETSSSIPGLWSGISMEEARACTPSAVCAGAGLFDFSKQTITRRNVNIAAFYHPYCLMKGLVYCRQIPVFGPASITVGFGCNLIKEFTTKWRPEACERQWLNSARAMQARSAIHDAAFAAPFWKDGGMLYIHTLLPHPPGAGDGGTLDDDYAGNIKLATDLVRELADKLEQKFAGNYLLVVTSDHPLRFNVWCSMYRYKSPGCMTSNRFASNLVPLIAIGKGAESVMKINNNFELFARLQNL
jgi:hypothetical protein